MTNASQEVLPIQGQSIFADSGGTVALDPNQVRNGQRVYRSVEGEACLQPVDVFGGHLHPLIDPRDLWGRRNHSIDSVYRQRKGW